MNRLEFFESVSGIVYPNMLVDFFDQFVALKEMIDNRGVVTINSSSDTYISANIEFKDQSSRKYVLDFINSLNGVVIIYQRPINVQVNEPE